MEIFYLSIHTSVYMRACVCVCVCVCVYVYIIKLFNTIVFYY